jgi:hypothetical protein
MRIRDLLRMWAAEQIFRKRIIIVARVPHQFSTQQVDEIRKRTRTHTGYETFAVPDRENSGVTFEFLPVAKRPELTDLAMFLDNSVDAVAADFRRNGPLSRAMRRDFVEHRPIHIPAG